MAIRGVLPVLAEPIPRKIKGAGGRRCHEPRCSTSARFVSSLGRVVVEEVGLVSVVGQGGGLEPNLHCARGGQRAESPLPP